MKLLRGVRVEMLAETLQNGQFCLPPPQFHFCFFRPIQKQ